MSEKPNYLTDFYSIITLGSKSNTYKFALARTILEFIKKNEDQISKNIEKNIITPIEYSEFAKSFLRYYWYQEFKFRINQNHQISKPPSVITILRHVFDKETLPETFEMVSDELKEKAIKQILQKVFGKEKQKTSQVIPRFQNIKGKKLTLYINNEAKKRIEVNPDAMKFFIHYRILLEKLVILEWAKFLEKIEPAPSLVSKIEDPEPDGKSLKSAEKDLAKFFKKCFYCKRPLEKLKPHVDHFIPRSYIFEDERWNFVLACSDCNLKKSNYIPQEKFLERLIEKNNDFAKNIPLLQKSLLNLNERVGWKKEIRRHYRNCKEYGFSEIILP